MNEPKAHESLETGTSTLPPPPQKKRGNLYFVIVAAIALVLIMIVVLSVFCYKFLSEKSELEKQLEVKNDAFAALEAQQNEQQTKIQNLQRQLEDLFHVEEPDPVITVSQIEEQLSSIKELATKEYIYTNASRREANKTWLWGWDMPFSDTSLLVTYDGTIKAGIDLNKVKVSVSESPRTITITVPTAEILGHDLPQETIKVLEVKNNLFNEITFDDYNEFIGAEKPVMEQKATERGLITEATNEAKMVIEEFLQIIPGMGGYTLIVK